MEEQQRVNLNTELAGIRYRSYPEIFGKFRELSERYGDLPPSALIGAFGSAMGIGGIGNMYTPDPYIQNNRIKGIATRPANYTKDEVGKFIQNPDTNEKQLRAVEKALEYSSYPLFHTRVLYQNLLTYHSYVAPHLSDRDDAKKDDFWREWKLVEKLRCSINPKEKAHEFAGLALQQGKIFVHPRVSVDKPHNQVNYAFLQQLPTDWCKIVGYNNISKYTVAFNLMYFCEMGTTWEQFGDLFRPYIGDFLDAVTPAPTISGKKIVYAKKSRLDLAKVKKAARNDVDAYKQNGRWFYWVTLPVDAVFPMEIDDTDRNVIPPFTGLFIDMIQLSQMEQLQLDLLASPLVSLLHGEIPYWDNSPTNDADQYKLSNAGMLLFESLWYQMLARNNTNGIGLFMAPLENMKLESLAEAPSAIEIVSTGYTDTMAKAGLTALIPTSDEARAGAVQVSLLIESQFSKSIYTCFERMTNAIIERLNLRYEWRFHMFGDLATDEKREKTLKEEMTLGILPSVLEYNAMHDRSLLDDIAWSDAVVESDLMRRRIPLVSSFNQSAKTVGRPPSEGVTSDGQEQDVDGNANGN